MMHSALLTKVITIQNSDIEQNRFHLAILTVLVKGDLEHLWIVSSFDLIPLVLFLLWATLIGKEYGNMNSVVTLCCRAEH